MYLYPIPAFIAFLNQGSAAERATYCQLGWRTPLQLRRDVGRLLLRQEHFTLIGAPGKIAKPDRFRRRTEIHVNEEWRFLATTALHDRGRPLLVRAGGFRDQRP